MKTLRIVAFMIVAVIDLLCMNKATAFTIAGTIHPTSVPALNWKSLQWDHATINLDQAYQYATTKGKGVAVCSVDTGVDGDNPDLAGSVLSGYNTRDILHPDQWQDDNGHGTFTSGQMVARGVKLDGVAPNASLLVAKVLDSSGSADSSNVTGGIAWCIDQGAKVINLSLGGDQADYDGYQGIIDFGCSVGVDFAVAAGNDGTDGSTSPEDPAAIVSPCLISTNAINKKGVLTAFSNYNENIRSVSAPGMNIIGLWGRNSLAYASGTSMAAPLVSGVLALLRGMGADAQTAVTDILASAVPPKDKTFAKHPKIMHIFYGAGLLDAGAATRLYHFSHQ